jgi:hypothetical protein
MAEIPNGTKFIGIDSSIPTPELNGSRINSKTQHYTIEDIAAFAGVGSQGPQGVEGPAGPPGPVGPAGLEWRGAWNTNSSYAVDDAVGFNGSSWFCISAVTGTGNSNPEVATTKWALLAAQGATGPQGAQGPTGPQGPAGVAGVLTSETLLGGPINTPSLLSKDFTALNVTDNNNTYLFSLPNMIGVANAIGKTFLVTNVSEIFTAQIRIPSGVTGIIRQNLSSNINGFTPQTNNISLPRGRTARFIYLGNLIAFSGGSPTQTWSLEFIETVRPKTSSSNINITSSTTQSINHDFIKFIPTSATFNKISLPFNPEDNRYLRGDSIIIANYSNSFELQIQNPNLIQYQMNGTSSSTPYVIPPLGIVRATLADGFNWVIETINS